MKKKISCLFMFLSTFTPLFSSPASYAIWQKDDVTITCFGDVHSYPDDRKDDLVLRFIDHISSVPSALLLEFVPARKETLHFITPHTFNKYLSKLAYDNAFKKDLLTFKLSDRRDIFGYELMNFLVNANLKAYNPETQNALFDQALSQGYIQPISSFIKNIESLKKEITSLHKNEKITEQEKSTLSNIDTKINDGDTILKSTIKKYDINEHTPLFETLSYLNNTLPKITIQFIDKILYPFLQTVVEAGFFVDILNEKSQGIKNIILYAGNNHVIRVNKHLEKSGFAKKAAQGISSYHKNISTEIIEQDKINDEKMANDILS